MSFRMLVLLLTFLHTCITSYSQISKRELAKFDASTLIDETKAIMAKLKINTRDSIKHDGAIITVVSDSLQGFKRDFGVFTSDSGALYINNDMSTRIYDEPVIVIARNIDSILTEKLDTSLFYEVYAKAVVIHELVHFLQETYSITDTLSTKEKVSLPRKDYISIKTEYEAFAVEAYYFLNLYSPITLNMIITAPFANTKDDLWQFLIDEFEKIVYGNPVFNRFRLM